MQFVIAIPLGVIIFVALAIVLNVTAAARRREKERTRKLQLRMEEAARLEAERQSLALRRSEEKRLKDLGKLIEQPNRSWRFRLPFIGRNS